MDWKCRRGHWNSGHYAVVNFDDGEPQIIGCIECDWLDITRADTSYEVDESRCVAGVSGWGHGKPGGARCGNLAVYGSKCRLHQERGHGFWDDLYRLLRSPYGTDDSSWLRLPEAYREVFIRAIRDAGLVADERQVKREAFERAKELRESSVVYFIEREGLIKIGVTRNIDARVKSISKGSSMPDGMTVGPVQLLATTSGDRRDEQKYHTRFRKQRIPKTEWFRPNKALRRLIEDLQRAQRNGSKDVLDQVIDAA